MKIFSLDGSLMTLLNKLANIMLINLCFIVFSLPVVTLGASACAMYRSFLMLAEDKGGSVVRLFFDSFISNFKKATLLFLVSLPAVILVSFDIMLYIGGVMGNGARNALLSILPFAVISCVVSYVFPLQAKFENSIWRTLKNAVILAVAHFPSTVVVTVLNLLFPALLCFYPEVFTRSLILWFLFGFAFVACINTFLLDRVFRKYY